MGKMTVRLIDANAIRGKAVPHTRGEYGYCADIRKWAVLVGDIDDAPTIEAEPVRYGHWVGRRLGSTDVICSKCSTLETNRDSNYKSRFCPNCGAKMDGDSSGPIKRK